MSHNPSNGKEAKDLFLQNAQDAPAGMGVFTTATGVTVGGYSPDKLGDGFDMSDAVTLAAMKIIAGVALSSAKGLVALLDVCGDMGAEEAPRLASVVGMLAMTGSMASIRDEEDDVSTVVKRCTDEECDLCGGEGFHD